MNRGDVLDPSVGPRVASISAVRRRHEILMPVLRKRGHFEASACHVRSIGKTLEMGYSTRTEFGARLLIEADIEDDWTLEAELGLRASAGVMERWSELDIAWRSASLACVSSEAETASALLACPQFWLSPQFQHMRSIAVIACDAAVILAFDSSIRRTVEIASGLAACITQSGDTPLSTEIFHISPTGEATTGPATTGATLL